MRGQDLCLCRGGHRGCPLEGVSGRVFVGDQVMLDISFDAARCRLGRLARDGVLLGACEHAYATGITAVVKAGVVAGMSQLAAVEPTAVAQTAGCARLGLRWETAGPGGAMFPALDADLTLSPAGKTATLLALAGVYRLPDPVGAQLEPAMVRSVAAVTIGSFLARLACALTHPAGTAIPAGPAGPNPPRRRAGRRAA
jgi:hypothetical protein